MTSTSDRVFVWTWLPGETEPVVAGVLQRFGGHLRFAYGRSYLARDDAISLYGPELPLREGWTEPQGLMAMPSALRDAAPDAWGRRVIYARITGRSGVDADTDELSAEAYLMESGSNRFGAVDFQPDPQRYVPRIDTAPLDELHRAALTIQEGKHLDDVLAEALVHGTSIGGARPKVLLHDGGDGEYIAKLSVSDDPYPVVNAEAVGLELARRCGLVVPATTVTRSLGREVLLVRRFDREPGGFRRHAVSGLTVLGLDEMEARYATYPDLLDVLRSMSGEPREVGPELFRRIVVNVAIGNTDDHARNHAAFWDGRSLELTPAYDLCPQVRSGETAAQAMAIDREGNRRSDFATCLSAAHIYGLDVRGAREIIGEVVGAIADSWDEAADAARLTQVDKDWLWRRQILNPSTSYGYESGT